MFRLAVILCLFSVILSFDSVGLTSTVDSAIHRLETVPPTLPSVLAATERRLTVTFSEPMLSPGVTTQGNYALTGAGMGTLNPVPTSVGGTGPYALMWPTGEMRNGAPLTVTATGVRDTVGNPIDPAHNFALGVGLGIPPFFNNLAVSQPQAVATEHVLITFTPSEPLSGDPIVTVNGHDATLNAHTTSYTYEYVVLSADPNGMADISISGFDIAGNPGSVSNNSLLEIVTPQTTLPLYIWPAGIVLLTAGLVIVRRRRLGVALLVLAILAAPTALAQGPVLSNVTFAQGPSLTGGTQVDIYYDIVAPNPCSIIISLSKNGGADGFVHPIAKYSGDIAGVTTGTHRHILWDIAADYPNEDIPLAGIRFTANDANVQHTLRYTAGANGTISGLTPQTVSHGGTGTPVTAAPGPGYRFVQWSDGVLTATRTDSNVTVDISVTATFAASASSLTVNILPAAANTAGAQWILDGGAAHASGATVTGLTPGSHIVSFNVLAGWIKAVSEPVVVTAGQALTNTYSYTKLLTSNSMVVFGYSELGMHCMNQDFSELMVLPPYNTFHAQVIDRSHGSPEIVRSGVTVSYTLPGNTTSATKTNFWMYAFQLFGQSFPPDVGLTGSHLSGTMAPDATPRTDWVVTGIPITPIEDVGIENPYSLAVVTVAQGGQNIVQTQAVVPVSWEISCELCHNTPGITPGTDILRRHDQMHGTTLEASKPVACGQCHAQPELGMPGNGTSHNLSRAMHGAHASRMTVPLTVACYACHPGIRTQCLRDIHFSKGMTCTSCHGQMTDVADPSRLPWQTEPRCETCHAATAPAGYQFEQAGTLFRNSKGHHNIMCATCHGSPHAITPTIRIEDNVQAIAIQGHAGTINTCSVCHSEVPGDPFPHRIGGGK